MKQEFTRKEVVNLLYDLLERPDLLIDAIQNEQTNYDAESLLEISESTVELDTDLRIEIWKKKAEKWDALENKIRGYYYDDNGQQIEDERLDNGMSLLDIGEDAARAFGFL